MKLTDYVADFLAKQGITHVFGLTGGAAVHLFDSVAKHPDISPVFHHHEQAAAFAVEAYARVSGNLGAGFVTTCPGGTNTITGVCAAWLDSVPCIFISGQARLEHTSRGKPIRQLGTQELDIVSLVSHITKYAVMVDDPNMIKYHLQKAAYIAKNGRPGPVWIDIPLNFQWANIEPEELPGFDVSQVRGQVETDAIKASVTQCLNLMKVARRPLLLAGYGIRLSNGVEEFRHLLDTLRFPFVSTYNASDMLPTDNQFYVGRPGISGQRGANLAVQNCDLLLCIGSHLCIPLTGTLFGSFAREAKIVMVDVDPVELQNQRVHLDLSIQSDAKAFLSEMQHQIPMFKFNNISKWLEKCAGYKSYNRIQQEWRKQKEFVNSYVFVDTLSDELGSEDVIVIDGSGTVFYTSFQGFKTKEGQRLITSSGIAAMGSGLPESIGACIASGKKRTVSLCGDGSMQFNIQELQTIFHHQLPIKVFIFNNGGYLSIRHTQKGFLQSHYVGSQPNGGMSLPDFQKIARAYGIRTARIYNQRGLRQKIRIILKEPAPVVCELMISTEQEVIPTQGFIQKSDGTFMPRPLEDMYPYLDRKEFIENMVVAPWVPPEL